MTNLIRRHRGYYVRFNIPRDRWADVGKAMGTPSGVLREVVRTLGTAELAEARRRRDPAIAAIRAELDAALVASGLRPITDWLADWTGRATDYRARLEKAGDKVAYWEDDPRGLGPTLPVHDREFVMDDVRDDAEVVALRHGPAAAGQFVAIATGENLSVEQALRLWLDHTAGTVTAQTAAGHRAALKTLETYLTTHRGFPRLAGVGLANITRPLAGEFIAARRKDVAAATVQREFSAYSGLWRWAVRRGYAETNPWADQTAGLHRHRAGEDDDGEERAYSAAELVTLIRADGPALSPGGGAYAPALWDAIRLGLLTGCRLGELTGLRRGDVVADGTAIIVAARGGKTKNARRLLPLHPIAQAVLAARAASMPDTSPEASLWGELPAVGPDERRGPKLTDRFIAARRRILGESDEVDFHSFRRSFATALETAMHSGGRVKQETISLLMGQQRGSLALDLYSDWTRLGRGVMPEALKGALDTLRAAVGDMVALGLDPEVRKALDETAAQRPPVIRTAPAFTRRKASRSA